MGTSHQCHDLLTTAAPPPRAFDWSFLTPWRDVLRLLLEYVDGDELTLGTIDNRLQSLRLRLNDAHPRLQKARGIFNEHESLRWIHEALELIGLVLHYDRVAWKTFLHPVTWDRDLVAEPFPFDECLDQLEPVFKLTLCEPGADQPRHFQDLCELLTSMPSTSLSDEYHHARQRIPATVGARWDGTYRFPLWIVLIPKHRVTVHVAGPWI
jgi:hypothetical protein